MFRPPCQARERETSGKETSGPKQQPRADQDRGPQQLNAKSKRKGKSRSRIKNNSPERTIHIYRALLCKSLKPELYSWTLENLDPTDSNERNPQSNGKRKYGRISNQTRHLITSANRKQTTGMASSIMKTTSLCLSQKTWAIKKTWIINNNISVKINSPSTL